jgi:hypothetical protein
MLVEKTMSWLEMNVERLATGGEPILDPTTTNGPVTIGKLHQMKILGIERVEVSFQGLDPMEADGDGDGVQDGAEARAREPPAGVDTDRDGLSDLNEARLGTNPMSEDSDRDGVRDGIEIRCLAGASEQVVIDPGTGQVTSCTIAFAKTKAPGSWMEKLRLFRNPYQLELVNNFFATVNGVDPATDPTDPDSDHDGLPDGFVDGWIYQTTNVNRSTALRLDSQNNRFAQVDSFRYDERRWAPRGEVDSLFQVWEFEDFDGDGKLDDGPDPAKDRDLTELRDHWDFDRGTFKIMKTFMGGQVMVCLRSNTSAGILRRWRRAGSRPS